MASNALWFRVGLVLTVVSLALCSGPLASHAGVGEKHIALVEFDETPVAEAVEYIRVRSRELDPGGQGINIVFDGDVDQQCAVSMRLRDVPIELALVHLFDHAGLDYRIDSHACFVLPGGSANIVSPPAPGPRALEYAAKARQLRLDRIAFTDAPLGVVVRYLADRSASLDPKGTGINLVLGAGVEAQIPVSIELANLPLSDVIRHVASEAGLTIRLAPGAVFLEYPVPPVPREAGDENTKLATGGGSSKNNGAKGARADMLGTIPNDPRSLVHPDYVGSSHPDPSKRTNALGNSYKWVGGRWTFVRHNGGLSDDDKKESELEPTRGLSPKR